MPDDPRALLTSGAGQLGVRLDAAAVARLLRYATLLERWNRVINLTSARSAAEIVRRHILDSLSVEVWTRRRRVLDVGSGAGFPGVVLACADPDLDVVVVDAGKKKVQFLTQVQLELQLHNLSVRRGRIEDTPATADFDTVTARALGSLAQLWQWAAPRLAADGVAVAFKGRYPAAELSALTALAVRAEVRRVQLPGIRASRHLVRMRRS